MGKHKDLCKLDKGELVLATRPGRGISETAALDVMILGSLTQTFVFFLIVFRYLCIIVLTVL